MQGLILHLYHTFSLCMGRADQVLSIAYDNISELFIFVSFVFVIGIRNFGYKIF